MLSKLRSERGFTLIELMVVILIIGILVAIAVPVFNAARENAYTRTCQANLRTLDGSAQTFRANNATGVWPATIAELVSGGFIKTAPTCPKSTQAYTYSIPGGVTQSSSPTIYCTARGATNPGNAGYENHTY